LPRVRCRPRVQSGNLAGVKLLFDENLSPRLAETLAGIYPSCAHVHACGLGSASDDAFGSTRRKTNSPLSPKIQIFRNGAFFGAILPRLSGFARETAAPLKSESCCEERWGSSGALRRRVESPVWCSRARAPRSTILHIFDFLLASRSPLPLHLRQLIVGGGDSIPYIGAPLPKEWRPI
jgi:uncharacterized protein DUF5615